MRANLNTDRMWVLDSFQKYDIFLTCTSEAEIDLPRSGYQSLQQIDGKLTVLLPQPPISMEQISKIYTI